MNACCRPAGWLFVAMLVALAACSPTADKAGLPPVAQTAVPGDAKVLGDSVATADPEVAGQVIAAFATYRSGVIQGDGDAVVEVLDRDSLHDMERVVELARSADEEEVRNLPAAEQLLVLTYRLRPELLEADDPYAALVEAGLAGQDRSLGELGEVTILGEDRALGVVVDPASGAQTPLRWKFVRSDGAWKFDLTDANRLLSQTVANGAGRASVTVDDLVAATVVDLSGEDQATVDALYTESPG
ncbi:hypothetical protein BH24ACT15_BH24ACT15_07960 [soil metagenome]